MPAPYNLTTNAADIAEMTVEINSATNGLFGTIILIMIGLVVFLSMKNQPVSSSLAVSMFIVFIVASLMFTMELLSIYIMGIIIALLAITTIILFFSR